MEIAKEILNQLRVLGGYKVMSWGAHNFTAYQNNSLLFKVNGRHFKGVVKITLNSMDLYDIEFYKKVGVITKTIEGIYFDDMVDVIDRYVEYIPEYGNI